MSDFRAFTKRLLPDSTIDSSRALVVYIVLGSLKTTAVVLTLDIVIHRVIDDGNALHSAIIAFLICAFVSPVLFLIYGLANMELDRVRQQLEILSRTDLQTGLLNRRAFMEAFERDAGRRSGIFLIADVDHFKQINDRYGHPAGDVAIKAIADIAGEVLSERAVVARIGGEEYAAALLDFDAASAMELAASFCAKVRERGVVIGDVGRIPLTVSIGIARITPATTFSQAYFEADRALYQAKRDGRDRVVAAWDCDSLSGSDTKCVA